MASTFKRSMVLALVGMAALVVPPAFADPVDDVNVYTIGSNPAGLALDPLGNPIGGVPVINWNHFVVGPISGSAFLSIIAEGIDTNEQDAVFFNNVFIGYLTHQGFQVSTFNLNPGAGAMANGSTALTNSVFDVTSLLLVGMNTISIQVDTENWVNEIETSSLRYNVVPEPGALALVMLALGGLALSRDRRR